MSARLHRVLAVAILVAVVAVAACGKKGDPVLPNGQKDDYPHSYPQSTEPQTGVFSN
ncbi:MAG TPA: lipoprotein [Dongiaceae bacterium]|nr:lipoprotein [Dongiaceae bacterium]